ncbi:hypothetical protein Acr_20g0010350 [Actinidia rufa]|uniref:Uncharacterized protein n=1 Tax=Actinidia rufa TaxID=165716 RepID=A0A7J0GEI9_9ERIC|nr:hypothetical protein Acr_20g0010350 [Actinidia rufa]
MLQERILVQAILHEQHFERNSSRTNEFRVVGLNFNIETSLLGRNIEESFKPKYRQKMLEPARVLGWNTLIPLPKNVYSDLVRLSVFRMMGELIFLEKPSQLKNHVNKAEMNETVSIHGTVGASQHKELKKEFRLFHKFISCNVTPKHGHHNQVSTMENFIIYRSAIEDPLNLNYIILREMAYVRTHKNRSLPYGALLTKIFEHFEVNLRNQSIQTIDEGFSSYMISRGITVDSTDEEDDLEMPSQAMGDVHMEDVSLDTEIPPEQSPQPQEGQTSQENPSDWFIQYFGQLRTTMERIEKTQKENNAYMKTKMDSIEQRQILNDKLHELHGTYIDRLGDNYEQLYTQQMEFHQECLDRLKAVQTIVEAESHFQYDPPPFSPHSQALMNLKGTKRSNSF